MSSSSSIQTSSFSIMFSLGRGGISCEATRSLSQKEGLVMVDCCRSGGFLVCSMLVSPCAVKTNSVFIAIDLVLTRTVSSNFLYVSQRNGITSSNFLFYGNHKS